MSKLEWGLIGDKTFQTGVSHGVLYIFDADNGLDSGYGPGIAWNGLTKVTTSPSGADANKQWADNGVYANIRGIEEFGGTIEAFDCPDEFAECDGAQEVVPGVLVHQQVRKMFGFAFQSLIGNDTKGLEYGYKIHLIYGATCSPTDRDYETVNESPEAPTMSWEYDTVPVPAEVEGNNDKTSYIEIDSTKVDPEKLTLLENKLYGTENTVAYLPMPDEVFETLGLI